MLTKEQIREILSHKETQKFIRFCIVGGICFLIDAAVFYSVRPFAPEIADHLRSFLGISVAPWRIPLVSGYIISLCFNYLLTVYWTFNTGASVRNLAGVVGAHLFNLFVVRMVLMWLFVKGLGMSDSVAYLPMAVISAITNYIVIRTVVKRSKEKS